MRFALAVAVCLAACPLSASAQKGPAATSHTGHYLFAWTGDAAGKGNDFLAVIDADPASPDYGHLVATLSTHQQTKLVHHTEYVMPRGGMFFASDYDAGRTFLFDVRDPLKPKIAVTFLGVDGYTDPHSYLRLPNGHVLSSFQHSRNPDPAISLHSGALVELDANGKFVRAASTADPALPHALLIPYSLVVLPKRDRVVSTNSAMDVRDGYGTTYQVWRLSDLKLLGTYFFDSGHDRTDKLTRKSRASLPMAPFWCRRIRADYSVSPESGQVIRAPLWSGRFQAEAAASPPSWALTLSRVTA